MGRRQHKRFRVALPVSVSGVDTSGNPFTQSATTVEISGRGVRVRGVRCLRGRGDPVQVEYKGKRARYRVAWIGQAGTCWEGLAGLEGVEGAGLLFAEHLPESSNATVGSGADCYAVEPAAVAVAAGVDHAAIERREGDRRQQERRRYPRFNCAGTARVWENGNGLDISARINEIAIGGCYVEMMSPMRVGQGIRLELAVNNRSIRLEGVVRTSQPNFGMGVEFTKMAPSEAEKLHRVVAELSGEPVAEAQAAALSPSLENTTQLGEALLRWFGSHDALSREDFLRIVEQLKCTAEAFTHA